MSWSFISHITDHLGKPSLDEQKSPTKWPSSATAIVNGKVVGKCRRQEFFRFLLAQWNFSKDYEKYTRFLEYVLSKKKPTETYLKWIWKQGEIYEDYCVDLAKESGVFVSGQTSVYIPQYNVSGKLDLIVVNPETTKYHIVEVKSVYGFNANGVLGTDAERRRGVLGTPRESHLMQIGLYQWWYANSDERFAEGLLVYGARDTGKYAEYKITVEKEGDLDYIFYQGNAPANTSKVNTGISIQSILENYRYVTESISKDSIPERDYELVYSQDRIRELYEAGELNKTDTAQYEKRQKQIEEGKTRLVKEVVKGDWQCRLCEYSKVCYEESNNPRELALSDYL